MGSNRLADLTVDFDGRAAGPAMHRAAAVFAEFGCLVARGLLADADLAPIRAAAGRLVALRRGHLGLPDAAGGEFDAGFAGLIRADPASRPLVQAMTGFAVPTVRLGADPRLVDLSAALMGTGEVIASDLQGVHIGLPGEAGVLLPWHQDYPWVQDSEDALIYWLPVRQLPPSGAGLRVALGSHRLGVLPLADRGGRMGLADAAVVERFEQTEVRVNVGDVLVLSTLLVHASAPNDSDRARWTVQYRHGNAAHPKAVRRGWPGPRPDRAAYHITHPEYVQHERVQSR